MTDRVPPAADRPAPEITPEQRAYAGVLGVGVRVAMVLLLGTFAIYASGVLPAQVPLTEVQAHWGESAREFASHTGSATGWGWARHLSRGDYLCFVGVVLLAGLSIVAFVRIAPVLARGRDYVYLALAIAQALVLILAASGLIEGVH